MDLQSFRLSLANESPPPDLNDYLLALWHEAKGEWRRAHELAQSHSGELSARLHAYLHRKEGDLDNAAYWYRRAKQAVPDISLEAEWETLVTMFLREP